MPITDCDLDVKNYFEKYAKDDEIVIYLRGDGDAKTNIIYGEDIELLDLLLDASELNEIILNAAMHIIKDNKLNVNEIYENITGGEEDTRKDGKE